MTTIESNHRHAEHNRKAMEYVKYLTSSLDGFDFASEKNNVKLYSRTSKESAVNIVRGDTILKTTEFTPREIAAIAGQAGTRGTWDEKFDSFELLEMFSHEECVWWTKFKTPWPVSPRDFVGTLITEHSENESFVCMSSVKDSLGPERSGCVRGTILISGWRLYKTDSGVGITYVTQVDLAGSIPASVLRSVNLQVPLCAGTVAEYATTYGFPPYISNSSSRHKGELFEHSKRRYEVGVEGGECQILASKRMYPNGIKVAISGKASYELSEAERGNYLITIKSPEGAATVTISKN